MKTVTKLKLGAGVAGAALLAAAINAPKEHQEDLDFRYSLEPAMHNVMLGKGALNLTGYEITSKSLFLDANAPTDLADEVLAGEGYTAESPYSPQAYALAACAVNATTNSVPIEAQALYQSGDLVGAGSTCLSTMVTAITNGEVTEVKAPIGLATD